MAGDSASWIRRTKQGVEVAVRLTPRSSRDAIEGGVGITSDGQRHLKARVRALPEDGKANAALEKLLAKQLGLPQRDVSIISGTTSRLKTVAIACDAEAVSAVLEALESWETARERKDR